MRIRLIFAVASLFFVTFPSEASAQFSCFYCDNFWGCKTTESGMNACQFDEFGFCWETGGYCNTPEGLLDAPERIRLASSDQNTALAALQVAMVWVVRNCRGDEIRRAYNAPGSTAMLQQYKTIVFRFPGKHPPDPRVHRTVAPE